MFITEQAPVLNRENERARNLALEIGLVWNNLTEDLRERFEKMDSLGHLEDCRKIIELARKIAKDPRISDLYSGNLETLFSNVMQSSTLSDIGKTGPKGASKAQSEFIIRIFQEHNVENPEKITLGQFMDRYLANFKTPQEINQVLESLGKYGVEKEMTMRQFYNLHTKWSLDILEGDLSISEDVSNSVARHHTLDGIEIIRGELTLEDKLVILLDKYDALRTRGNMDHKSAIKWIEDKIRNSAFSNDKEFEKLLRIVEEIAPTTESYK